MKSLVFLLTGISISVYVISSPVVNPPAGRIAIVADGNSPDPDDIGATAVSIAMLRAAGLEDRLVHYSHCCEILRVNRISEKAEIERHALMQSSCDVTARRWGGFESLTFYDAKWQLQETIKDLADAINASTAEDPLWIVEAGEPDVIGFALDATSKEKHKYVKVVTHHPANDDAGDFYEWQEILDFGVEEVRIPDQNINLKVDIEEWDWAKDHPDSRIQQVWLQGKIAEVDDVVTFQKGKWDCSDAGMILYWITGATSGGFKQGTVADVKELLLDYIARNPLFQEGSTGNKPGHWTTLDCTGEPDPRHETAFVEVKGKFYMIGGRESRKIDRFDPETNTWSKMKAESPLIHHFQPVVLKNKIYMVGAMTGGFPNEPPMSHVQIYDPKKDKWTEGAEIPEERRRGSAGTVIYDGKIYMACGITLGHTSGTNNWFDVYDPVKNTWEKLPDAPHIRDHFSAVVLDDKLYLLGGRNTSYHGDSELPTYELEPSGSNLKVNIKDIDGFLAFFGAVVREIDCYDFKSGKWSTLETKLPVGSAAGGTVVLDGKIIYFGGETAEDGPALNRTWSFDPATYAWEEQGKLNQGRHGSQAIVYKDKVYIAGGSPNRGGGRTGTIEAYSNH